MKKGHFLYRLFCVKGIFLTFVFCLNVWCIEYTCKISIFFKYQKKLGHTLLLLVFNIVESIQCILNDFLCQ